MEVLDFRVSAHAFKIDPKSPVGLTKSGGSWGITSLVKDGFTFWHGACSKARSLVMGCTNARMHGGTGSLAIEEEFQLIHSLGGEKHEAVPYKRGRSGDRRVRNYR